MTHEEELLLSAHLTDVLNGADALSFSWPDEKTAYAYRLIRWEADVPLTEDKHSILMDALSETMQPAGVAAGHFSTDGDSLTVFLCLTRFPAKVHRETVLWLCAHALMEICSVKLEQEGTMFIGDEFISPLFWQEACQPMREISEWWNQSSVIPESDAFRHRAGLQTIIKRRQYGSLGGYVTRALRSER